MIGASARVLTTSPVPGMVVTDTIDFSSRFDGVVDESNETGAPGFGSLVELRLVGQLIHRDFHNTMTDASSQVDKCPNDTPGGTAHRITISKKEQNIATTTTFLVSFILPASGGFQLLHAENYDSGDPNWTPATGSLSLLDYDATQHPCKGLHVDKNETRYFNKSPLTATGLPENSGSMTDPNTVTGSFSLSDPAIDPPAKYEFNWSFTRQKAAPQ